MKDRIYARKTIKSYRNAWNYYCDAMRDAGFLVDGHRPRTLEESAQYMPQYIEELKVRPGRWRRSLSAYTIRIYFAAPAKIMGLHAQDYDLPARRREDIKRSRERSQEKDFSEERNKELVDFCRCVGLRADKELARIKGDDLVCKDGIYYIYVRNGKGGKKRLARVTGTEEEIQAVVKRMRAKRGTLVWPNLPSHCDIHGYRAQYAQRVYEGLARDPRTLSPKERYCCRGDMKGIWLDKEAMKETSKYLGHTRITVIAGHYLWGIKKNAKKFLEKQRDNIYVEASEAVATYTALPSTELAKLEAELIDCRKYIDNLRQALREKSNRARKARPAKSMSGYRVLSVTVQPAFHLTEEKTVKAYMVTLDTPWSMSRINMDTAQKMWEADAESVCRDYGLEYLPEGWKGKMTSEWKKGGYAFGGLPAADYVRRYEYTISFIASKPPVLHEWELPGTKKKAPQS